MYMYADNPNVKMNIALVALNPILSLGNRGRFRGPVRRLMSGGSAIFSILEFTRTWLHAEALLSLTHCSDFPLFDFGDSTRKCFSFSSRLSFTRYSYCNRLLRVAQHSPPWTALHLMRPLSRRSQPTRTSSRWLVGLMAMAFVSQTNII